MSVPGLPELSLGGDQETVIWDTADWSEQCG